MKNFLNLIMIFTICVFATAALAQEKGFVFYEVTEAYFNTENMTFDLLNKNIDIAPFGIEPGSWISENTNTDTSYFLVTEGDHRMAVMIAVGATRKPTQQIYTDLPIGILQELLDSQVLKFKQLWTAL